MGKASKNKKAQRRPSGDPRKQGKDPALRGMSPDDEVPVLIVPGDAEPPPDEVAELIGTLTKGAQLEDGSSVPPGSRVYRSTRQLTRAEIAARPGAMTMTFGDFAKADFGEEPGEHVAVLGDLRPARPSVAQVREAAAESIPGKLILGGKRDDGEPGLPEGLQAGDIIADEQPIGYVETDVKVPGGAEISAGSKVWRVDPAMARQLEAAAEDLPGRPSSRPAGIPGYQVATGADAIEALRQAELDPAGHPVIDIGKPLPAGQSQTAIAGLGTYDPQTAPDQVLAAQGRRGPEIVITDDLDALDTADVDLVIEDLDPGNPDDAGRVLIGKPEQVRRYHDRARTLNERMTARLGQSGRHAVTTEAAADLIRLRTGWDADTVLGHHAWLTRHYRDPGAELADYLAFIMREQTGESFLSAGIFWPVDLSHGPADEPEGRQLAQIISRGLGDAGTYQVTRAMCEQMRQTWEQSGVHADPLPLSESELPVPAGFCWLDKPWMIREDEGHWLPVRAVSWERTITMAASERWGGATVPMDAVRMCIWLAIEDTVAFGHWEDEARAARTATWLGQVVLHRVILLPFDFGDHVNRGHSALIGILGLLHTLWMYLGMELPRSRPVPAQGAAVRRRAQRSLNHSDITIITLRKYDYIGDRPAGFPKIVNWSCRWWVEKFFRHIDPYDDADAEGRRRRHKPVPALRSGSVLDDDHDICAVCLANGQTVRISEVHGFFKGPTDKPLRTPSRDRTLNKLSR